MNQKMRRLLRNTLLTIGILAVTVLLCSLLAGIHDDDNAFASPMFILAIAIIARVTDGYLYGVCASVISVLIVNYMYVYPFGKFSLSITGYPLTFAIMLIVTIIISTLTTQIKRQEQMRFDAEAEKMRANLLRSISHDLRTPLASILGSSSAIIENRDMDAETRADLLNEINHDAQWLIRMTENLLSITKCSGDTVQLRMEPDVVEEIVSSAIHKFSVKHPKYEITVERPEEILLARMDCMLIEQVLINLFENVDAHAQTATRIHVQIAREGGNVRVSVIDNGAGFPPSILPKVFDGMAMAKERVTDSRRSMGIGLSVCRTILRAHNGDIRAENRVGGGCVTFCLPIDDSITEETEMEELSDDGHWTEPKNTDR